MQALDPVGHPTRGDTRDLGDVAAGREGGPIGEVCRVRPRVGDRQVLVVGQPEPATPAGGARWVGEFVNAFGLLSVYLFTAKSALTTRAAMLGCYLAIAFWFTGTTSCANPAITLAQGLAAWNGASGVADTASAILAQLAGASVAYGTYRGIIREQ